jgi:hypothetical protein
VVAQEWLVWFVPLGPVVVVASQRTTSCGASLIELSGTIPPGVGSGQKFTHMAPPPPSAREAPVGAPHI